MTVKYFNLSDGSLEFNESKLIIFDNAKRDRVLNLLVIFFSLTYAIVTMLRGYKQHDTGVFYFGLGLTLIWLTIVAFRHREFQKIENEIPISDINHVRFSMGKFDGLTIARIFTKKGLQRKIKIVREDNQDFYFKDLLVDNKINVD